MDCPFSNGFNGHAGMRNFDTVAVGRRWRVFMDEATDYVQRVARDGAAGEEVECAKRIIRAPRTWRRWEMELGTALRPVANFRSRLMQVRTLREANITWVHRAAPFRYLRDQGLRGEHRRRLISALHGESDNYARTMVLEHDAFVRSVCHNTCSGHLGEALLGDPLYRESMQRYQALYMDYFQVYGTLICDPRAAGKAPPANLLPMLKKQLAELRKAILDYPNAVDWLQREADIRKPTGDTQYLAWLHINTLD
jgi:hypothetical protein